MHDKKARRGRIYRCQWAEGQRPADAEGMSGSENEQDDDDDEEQSMEERIETVREWASTKLVFTSDDYMFASDVRAQFKRDTGKEFPDTASYFRGIKAAARLQGFTEEVRGVKYASQGLRRGRIYRCRWAEGQQPADAERMPGTQKYRNSEGVKKQDKADLVVTKIHLADTLQHPSGKRSAEPPKSERPNRRRRSATPPRNIEDGGYYTLLQKAKDAVAPEPETLVGRIVRRFFPGHGWFEGTIRRVINRTRDGRQKLFGVIYDDGDSEHLSLTQIRELLLPRLAEQAADKESVAPHDVDALCGVGGSSRCVELIGRELRLQGDIAERLTARYPDATTLEGYIRARVVDVQLAQPGSGDDEMYTAELRASEGCVCNAATGVSLTVWDIREAIQPTATAVAAICTAQMESYAAPLLDLQHARALQYGVALQRLRPTDTQLSILLDTAVQLYSMNKC